LLKQTFGPSLAILLALTAACSTSPSEEGQRADDCATISSPIMSGSLASDHPEAALITLTRGGAGFECSGAVIAPRVVLTAGHCVVGMDSWTVTAPFVSTQKIRGTGEALDWTDDDSHMVHPEQHDVGLIYLDEPIVLDRYPVLRDQPVPDGTTVVNIGRILDGTLSTSQMFVSKPLTVQSAAGVGLPMDYVAQKVIEEGDSGGPVVVSGTYPHIIAAVNSGAGGLEVLARVDLVKGWIDHRIAEHGGPGQVNPAAAARPPCPARP
jgi:secreted trypsin-like serine protease